MCTILEKQNSNFTKFQPHSISTGDNKVLSPASETNGRGEQRAFVPPATKLRVAAGSWSHFYLDIWVDNPEGHTSWWWEKNKLVNLGRRHGLNYLRARRQESDIRFGDFFCPCVFQVFARWICRQMVWQRVVFGLICSFTWVMLIWLETHLE